MQYRPSPAQRWFLALIKRTMDAGVSTRSGSKLSGEGPGGKTSRLDLNRQMEQTNDPQGMYVCGPDGTPYGFTNDHDPDNILNFMDLCLKRYAGKPPKPVVVTEAEKNAPFSITPAPTTQVLQVYSRIPKVPAGCSYLNEGIGRDFCWVYQNEADALVRAARSGSGTVPFPLSLTRRIARFHLLDNVRGTPDLWTSADLRRLEISAKMEQRPGDERVIRFSGPFALQNKSGKRGYQGKLDGYLHINLATHRIARFRAYADGKAWGAGTYTPNQPPGRYQLVVALLDTTDPMTRLVPPEEVVTENRDTRYRNP